VLPCMQCYTYCLDGFLHVLGILNSPYALCNITTCLLLFLFYPVFLLYGSEHTILLHYLCLLVAVACLLCHILLLLDTYMYACIPSNLLPAGFILGAWNWMLYILYFTTLLHHIIYTGYRVTESVLGLGLCPAGGRLHI
jgi:hypothetical protein